MPTNICIDKAMVFPVVMYGCESWTTKESWALKNWYFQIVVLEKTLESPLDSKEIKPVNPKGNEPWIFIERTGDEAEGGHLMWKADSLKKTLMLGKIEGKRRRGQQRMEVLGDITDSMNLHLSKLRETMKDKQARHAAVHGVAKSWTQLTNWRSKIPVVLRFTRGQIRPYSLINLSTRKVTNFKKTKIYPFNKVKYEE